LNRPRLALANAWIGELTAATEASFDRLEAYLKTLNPPQESSE
jgi:hypothetical protein